MPRPRKVSDDAIYQAALRAMDRLSPSELSLAEIAKEAGVTASAIVQRFGSKRTLLLTMSKALAESTKGFISGLLETSRSPLAALLAYADCMAGLASSPAALFRNLAYLEMDLTDPEFRANLALQAKATRAGLRRVIEQAISAGELLPSAKPAKLARTVETVLSGSLFTWGLYQEGTAGQWMRADLTAVLEPYRTARPGTVTRRRSSS